MVIRTLFDRVTRRAPMDSAAFIDHYNSTARWLMTEYGERYALDRGVRAVREAYALDDTSAVRDEYELAAAEYVIYLETGNPDNLAAAMRYAESAYKTVWRKESRGKVLNIRATNDPYSSGMMRKGDEN